MNLFKAVWALLFRLFPCPTESGLRMIGNPGRQSPVLVTCNFYLTVRRLTRALRGLDIWVIVGQSKGVNVWCAAGGDIFNTHSVVAALKTSRIGELVDHRIAILPPLSAPGVNAREVREKSGWRVKWGPVRARDIPVYLEQGCHRDESAKRVTYDWFERLDTAAGTLFSFYLLGALGFWLFGFHLLIHYLVVGGLVFFLFMLLCPWIPGARGLTKVIFFEAALVVPLVFCHVLSIAGSSMLRKDLIIAMVMAFVYGSELGGMAPHMKSALDPFLARLGVGAIGNVALAGTVRTELLNGYRRLTYDEGKCIACRCCVEVCPVAVWSFDEASNRAVLAKRASCTACRACLVQCKSGAIDAPLKTDSSGEL